MQNSLSIFSSKSNIKFLDLYSQEGVENLYKKFLDFFKTEDENLFLEFEKIKENSSNFSTKEESNLLIEFAKILELFLVQIFNIEQEDEELWQIHQSLKTIYQVKRDFVQRQISRDFQSYQEVLKDFTPNEKIIGKFFPAFPTQFELSFAKKLLIAQEKQDDETLQHLKNYAAFALFTKQGKETHQNGTLFRLAQKIDPLNLIDFKIDKISPNLEIKSGNAPLKDRKGFKLTDSGFNLNQILGEANYCIFCHNQGKDSCSKGLLEKDSKEFKKDFFGEELQGCPLEEKISEMNFLKSEGFSIAALAMAIIDNPMLAATGHRICNDCQKSCIYQKQEPVDIPQIETKILRDVLNLPYGFEIYSLLTRFNPLNIKRPIVKNDSGYKVLVAGLGPAGFTLAHYLLNEGHLVVAIDGLKIEPLSKEISGIDIDGNRCNFKPIKDIKEIYEDLDQRPVYGFGGVAEYGITARFDKNFLKIIRLILERRKNFRMFGAMRLGSAFDCYDALNEIGFDHVALCLGAGWPNILDIKNIFAKGVRAASDFLMALQLTGAMRRDLPVNLQVRLPIVVAGAGLTAIDTACEALAYYVVQVENFAHRYEILLAKIGKEELEKNWNEEDKLIAQEFLHHASQIRLLNEEQNLQKVKSKKIIDLLQEWGGAKIVYRKEIHQSPSYQTNHLEISKALEEGVEIIDQATPKEILIDKFNHIRALEIIDSSGQSHEIAAKSLFIAIGTSPNKAPAYEDKMKFTVENNSYQIFDLMGQKMQQVFAPKHQNIGFLASIDELTKKSVSFFGDTHKAFAGSVVKAMASAKKGFPLINQSLELLPKNSNYKQFLEDINQQFKVEVFALNILSENIFELIVKAPILAKKTKIGHIFRLQNYHALAPKINETLLGMEGVALTVYKVDRENGLIGVIIVNAGGSSLIAKYLKVGENIIFMGPSGTPSHIVQNKTVVFLAAGRGVFPLSALSKEHQKQGCKTTLFCGFRKNSDIVRIEELANSCDNLVISVEEKPDENLQKYGQIFHGNLVEAFVAFAKKDHFKKMLDYQKIDLIFAMGNEEMMHQIAKVRHLDLKDELSETHISITSLNNPMQCMMKGVCSQCLQKKTDSKTGATRYFYSCISQDQKSDEIDFDFLKNRCNQNSLQEKLTKSWIDKI